MRPSRSATRASGPAGPSAPVSFPVSPATLEGVTKHAPRRPRPHCPFAHARPRSPSPMAVDAPSYEEKTDIQQEITEMVHSFVDKEILPVAEHFDHEDEFP